jgi:hypothetical protein
MKAIRVELTTDDHHALRVAAATANQTMRQFARAALLRAVRATDPTGSGATPTPNRLEQTDEAVGGRDREPVDSLPGRP